ncbi:MAG: YceI family protein [Candidatus Marinimicrobia bacterium]|nr:YceI family protein [Candidatus Neomarinimicrobiota bacterium]
MTKILLTLCVMMMPLMTQTINDTDEAKREIRESMREQEQMLQEQEWKQDRSVERIINLNVEARKAKQGRRTKANTNPSIILNKRVSTLEWKGGLKFLNKNHNGNLKIKAGSLFLEDKTKITGTITVNMLSISNIDLPDSKKEYLIGHLRSEDFFHVERFPIASLKINNSKILEKQSNGKYNMEVSGDLTIKSITKSITFMAIVDLDSDVKSATGTMQFNRADFGVQYRTEMHLDDAKSFWNSATTTKEALKDKVIKDEINIKFNIVSMPGLLER